MRKRLSFALLFLTCIVLGGGCKEDKRVVKTPAIAFTKEGELTLRKASSDSIVAQIDIEIADTDYETQTGLMYRDGMEDDQGMFFVFDEPAYHSFYMKNTKFSIDIIFIDADLRIASFKERAKPLDEGGLYSEVPVQYVLEVNAGLAEQWQLEIGDQVSFTQD